MAICNLLKEVHPLVKKNEEHKNNRKAQGEDFNLFTVMGVDEKEVYICRVIGELLNPNGCHNLKDLFLKSFIRLVLRDEDLLNENLLSAKVMCEDSTEEGRRIDITIQLNKRVIPIEVKIKAGDQVGQCADYLEEIQKRIGKEISPYICYLTIDGHQPSSLSMEGKRIKINENVVKCLSWHEDILKWLEYCLTLEDIQRRTIVLKNIWQLVDIIRGWGDFLDNKTLDIIKENDENIESAIQIWRTMEEAKSTLISNFIEKFEKNLNNYPLERIGNSNSKFPRDYCYKKGFSKKNPKVIISLCLHPDGNQLYMGFRTFKDKDSFCGDINGLDIDRHDLESELPPNIIDGDHIPSDWKSWIYRKKFPQYLGNDVDFTSFTNDTLKLLQDGELTRYIEEDVMPMVEGITGWTSKKP